MIAGEEVTAIRAPDRRSVTSARCADRARLVVLSWLRSARTFGAPRSSPDRRKWREPDRSYDAVDSGEWSAARFDIAYRAFE